MLNTPPNTVDIPILFIIFNRPQFTERTFAAIRQVKPKHLYIVADGPRATHPDDQEKCKKTRKIVEAIDWDCEVVTRFQDQNLGCKMNVATGIDWFFEQVEAGIILEDDTVPDPSFFPFCAELLEKYKDDERIMQICGANFNFGWTRNEYSYYHSSYGFVWGWASWRRAWQKYDVKMDLYPFIKEHDYFNDIYAGQADEVLYRRLVTEETFQGKLNTWDYQWWFCKLIHAGLSIVPNKNLVTNIGFGEEATHTFNKDHVRANVPAEEMDFPLQHPPFVIKDLQADRKIFELAFQPHIPGLLSKGILTEDELPQKKAEKADQLQERQLSIFNGKDSQTGNPNRLHLELEDLRHLTSSLEQELTDIKNSYSWRIGRGLTKVIGGIFPFVGNKN